MKRGIIGILLSAAVLLGCAPKASAVSPVGISAKAYALIEAQSGKIIVGKNENTKLPMASTTKIMSALLLIESGDLDSRFKVNNDAIMVEGSSMGLRADDIVTKRDLCCGMLLPSGNDAANETAYLLAGGAEDFAKLMNKRAEQIGMKNTNFVTPSGLHDDDHYSSAYDMAALAREAMKNETFRGICGSAKVKLEFGNPPYERWLVNTNKLLSLYDGCIGIKTGFTDEAGRCLVSAAERNGATLICVTLNASDDWNDHIKLLDYGFSVTESRRADFDFSGLYVDVAGGDRERVRLVPSDIPLYTVLNGEMPEATFDYTAERFLYAPVAEGKKAGTIRFYADGELIGTSDLTAAESCGAVIKERKLSLYEKIIDWIKKRFV